jgi:uncharacterized NAD(P)/FAD-binding protein YdhS
MDVGLGAESLLLERRLRIRPETRYRILVRAVAGIDVIGNEALVERHAGARHLAGIPEIERHGKLTGKRTGHTVTNVDQRIGTRLGLVVQVLAGQREVPGIARREADRGARTRHILATLRSQLAAATAVLRAARDGKGIVRRAAWRDRIRQRVSVRVRVGPDAIAVAGQQRVLAGEVVDGLVSPSRFFETPLTRANTVSESLKS